MRQEKISTAHQNTRGVKMPDRVVYEEEVPIDNIDYNGISYIVICPCCGDKKVIQAYNYVSNGKKCNCGAILKNGMAYKKYYSK